MINSTKTITYIVCCIVFVAMVLMVMDIVWTERHISDNQVHCHYIHSDVNKCTVYRLNGEKIGKFKLYNK